MIPVPKSVAFEISNEDSIIKKHPPKRFLRLEEQQHQLTAKELLDKQIRAEEKRQEILEEKKLKAHKYQEKVLKIKVFFIKSMKF